MKIPIFSAVNPVLACSGPEAPVLAFVSAMVSYISVAAGFRLIVVLLRGGIYRGRWNFRLPMAVLTLIFHPAWTIGALDGDCGLLMVSASLLLLVLYIEFERANK